MNGQQRSQQRPKGERLTPIFPSLSGYERSSAKTSVCDAMCTTGGCGPPGPRTAETFGRKLCAPLSETDVASVAGRDMPLPTVDDTRELSEVIIVFEYTAHGGRQSARVLVTLQTLRAGARGGGAGNNRAGLTLAKNEGAGGEAKRVSLGRETRGAR